MRSLSCRPLTSSSIACGWSPLGSNGATSLNFLPPSLFCRPRRPVRHPDLIAELGPAGLDQRLERVGRGGRAQRGRVVVLVLGLLEARRARQLRVEIGGSWRLALQLERALRPLGHAVADAARGAIGLLGLGHCANMGRREANFTPNLAGELLAWAAIRSARAAAWLRPAPCRRCSRASTTRPSRPARALCRRGAHSRRPARG